MVQEECSVEIKNVGIQIIEVIEVDGRQRVRVRTLNNDLELTEAEPVETSSRS